MIGDALVHGGTLEATCGEGGLHRWRDDRCWECGAAWVDYAAEARASGVRVVSDGDRISATYSPAPRVLGWVVFGRSVLDDPEALAAMIESARVSVARQSELDPERVAWEEPLVGRTWANSTLDDPREPLGRVYVMGDVGASS